MSQGDTATRKHHGKLQSDSAASTLIGFTEGETLAFSFDGQEVRTLGRVGETWFAAQDVCHVLDITNSRDALTRLDADEKGVGIIPTSGGDQTMNVISESGVYSLIFTSRKPQAKAFRRRVTQIVLPSIRKTGRYQAAHASAATGSEASIGHTTVALPSYGRFILMNTPAGVQVDNGIYAIAREFAALDCRVLSHKVKAIQGFWLRYKQLTSLGEVCADGCTRQSLEDAITDAATQAQRHILAYERDEEDVTKH